MGEEGSKSVQNCVTSFMDDPEGQKKRIKFIPLKEKVNYLIDCKDYKKSLSF